MTNRVQSYLASGEACQCAGCRFRRAMDAPSETLGPAVTPAPSAGGRADLLGGLLLVLAAIGGLAVLRLAVR
jgi:hypothetical protein